MPLRTLQEYEELAAHTHGHLCAGQILGIRMALFGLKLLGIEDPLGADRKRLLTYVEIDRCATDAVSVVTGCRLGKRTLKFRDYGKTAATFFDLKNGRAVRVSARESSRQAADELHPEIEDRNARQMRAFSELDDDRLFAVQWVRVDMPEQDLPGYRAQRVVCSACGEGVSFGREVSPEGVPLCRACAGDRYYEPLR